MTFENERMTRRQVLTLAAGSAAAVAFSPRFATVGAAEPSTTPARAATRSSDKRFKIAGDDLFLNNRRQNLQAFTIAQKAGLDGIQVDMGRMPGGKELINELRKPEVREAFIAKSRETGVEICSLAWFAMYARPFATLPIAVDAATEWVDTMQKMNVRLGFMPLMATGGTLREPEVYEKSVDVFKKVAPLAEKAGVVLGVESNVDADGYKRFLDAVGSPAVQAFYSPGRALEEKFDAYADIRALGKERICALHLEQGSVPPEDFERRLGDGLIDFQKLRAALLDIGWGGWMSIARSRLKGTTSADTNMSANAKFVRSVFPE